MLDLLGKLGQQALSDLLGLPASRETLGRPEQLDQAARQALLVQQAQRETQAPREMRARLALLAQQVPPDLKE